MVSLLFGVLRNASIVWDAPGDKANTLGGAEARALAEARAELIAGRLRATRSMREMKTVSLRSVLGEDFLRDPCLQ